MASRAFTGACRNRSILNVAVAQQAVAEVSQRIRVFSHGNGNRINQDPQVLQVIGKVSAQAYAAG